MRNFILFFTAMAIMAATGCESGGEQQDDPDKKSEKDDKQPASVMEKEGLKVYPKKNSPNFEDATIITTAPTNGSNVDAGEVKFTYDITNYKLGEQTDNSGGLANSGDGQHIHAILNNRPYMAKYKPEFKTDLEDGHYVLLSFLSRSYHESVKGEDAYDLVQFAVGDGDPNQADLSAPHMFYSRPKGTYQGQDTDKMLLDWYLVNCNLSKDGYKVRATINGTSFTFDKWQPYIVEGLAMGDVSIKLELLDGNGNLVDSPFNPVERTVTLEEAGDEG